MPNNISIENTKRWILNGADPDLSMDFDTMVAGTVEVGEQWDRGKIRHLVERFKWRFTIQFEAAPVVGEIIEIYLALGDGVNIDGEPGAVAAAGDVNMLRNMLQIGTLAVSSVDADHTMSTSGVCLIPARYVSPVIFNNTADDPRLVGGAEATFFKLTRIDEEDFAA